VRFEVRFWREWWKRVVPWRQFAEVEEIRRLERIPRSEMYELIERCQDIFFVPITDPVVAIVDPVSISAFNELLFARGGQEIYNTPSARPQVVVEILNSGKSRLRQL
jgi:hypothetical protein